MTRRPIIHNAIHMVEALGCAITIEKLANMSGHPLFLPAGVTIGETAKCRMEEASCFSQNFGIVFERSQKPANSTRNILAAQQWMGQSLSCGCLIEFRYQDLASAINVLSLLYSMGTPSPRCPYRMGWISRRSPVCWATTTRVSPCAPTPTPPGVPWLRAREQVALDADEGSRMAVTRYISLTRLILPCWHR